MPINATELKVLQRRFAAEQREYLASAEGEMSLGQTKEFAQSVRLGGEFDPEQAQIAGATLAWMARIPEKLDVRDGTPLLDLEVLKTVSARGKAIGQSLEVLTVGAQALLVGGLGTSGLGQDAAEKMAAATVQTAFGGDAISRSLRTPLLEGFLPLGIKLPGIDQARLDKLIRAGALHKLLAAFAECGLAAQDARNWNAQITALGEVVEIRPPRACPSDTVEVSYKGFGSTLPAAGSRIVVALPTAAGCTHVFLDQLLVFSTWADSGTMKLQLPADVSAGAVGFFLLPPPLNASGPCVPGHLLDAAGEWQTVLAREFKEAGVISGQQVLGVAGLIEAGRLPALPCASAQPNGLNLLRAGAPIIDLFRVVEVGPVHPRGTVTVEWSVRNAEAVAIYARSTPDSPNSHELPNLPVPLATTGRVQLNVPCYSRWSAMLILEASNGNACGAPQRAEVRVDSGFSHWLLGVGKVDVTDRRAGLGMAGFAYERQTTDGRVQLDNDDREVPLFARAFCIRENRQGADQRQLVLLVADIWTASIALKREVLRRLNAAHAPQPGQPERFRDDNVLIAGTHTHAGPGGYSEYPVYNLTLGGYKEGVFETIVGGMVAAVQTACATAKPGRLYVNQAMVKDCGANRSLEAYQRNPEAAGAAPEEWTDREMLLLRFQADSVVSGRQRELGVLNWYAIHPTSLGMFNRVISGDNKGWAEMLFEKEMSDTSSGFVAAFGNGNAGDVSGNVVLDANGGKTARRPLGGERPSGVLPIPALSTLPGEAMIDQVMMQTLRFKQFEAAKAIFDTATFELTGRLDSRHCWVDMSNEPIAAVPGERTWPAALGVSFGAGSSEDSIAYATMGFLDVDAAVPEGFVKADMTPSGILFWSLVSAQLLTNPAAAGPLLLSLATRAPMLPATTAAALPLIAALLLPGPRAYGAAFVASLSLAGKLLPVPLSADGSWQWKVDWPIDCPPDMVAGHGAKPIMFALGTAKLVFTPNPGSTVLAREEACPLVPQVLPMQLLRIGSLAVAGVPAEFTGMAGRRLKATLRQAFGPGLSHVAVSNYSNGYSGYVSTREEYSAQHYEGASTLYGEFTLMAYQQRFETLVQAMLSGTQAASTQPFTVPEMAYKP